MHNALHVSVPLNSKATFIEIVGDPRGPDISSISIAQSHSDRLLETVQMAEFNAGRLGQFKKSNVIEEYQRSLWSWEALRIARGSSFSTASPTLPSAA